jgi:group I intron endonuclease
MKKNNKKVIWPSPSSIKHIKRYNNLLLNKSNIIKENFRKSGIYMISSNFNHKIYIGRLVDLGSIFRDYLYENYLKKQLCNNKSIIYSALLKGGYNNFELYILEYCDKNSIVIREQHYIDLLNLSLIY